MKLAELMSSVTLTDAHLVHDEAEIETATMADDWSLRNLTAVGQKEWRDVLYSTVKQICETDYGLTIVVSGCAPLRLQDFMQAQAGYCSEKNYERWFCFQEEEDPRRAVYFP